MRTIVITSERHLSEKATEKFEKEVRKAFPGDRILILEGGLKLQVETSKAK